MYKAPQPTTSYRRVERKRFPTSVKLVTPENEYWNSFRRTECVGSSITRSGHIPVVSFCEAVPYDCALISGRSHQLSILSVAESGALCVSNQLSFKNELTHCSLRNDGRLVAVCGKNSMLRVYNLALGRDTVSEEHMETGEDILGSGSGSITLFKSLNSMHKSHVNLARFRGRIGNQLASIGDDHTVRLFDITEIKQLSCIDAHSDFVKCGEWYAAEEGLFLSGSYDHSVKLWDIRSGEKSATIERTFPVESVTRVPNTDLICVAGGPRVDVFSLRKAGGAPMASLLSHRKTVTDLSVTASGSRLLTSCLDYFVRIFDVHSFAHTAATGSSAKMTHSFKCDSAVLSVDISFDGMSIATGTLKHGAQFRNCAASGSRTRLQEIIDAKQKKAQCKDPMMKMDSEIRDWMRSSKTATSGGQYPGMRYGSKDWFLRGQKSKVPFFPFAFDKRGEAQSAAMGAVTGTQMVVFKKKKQLKAYDVALKEFRYGDALDMAIAARDTLTLHSVLEELWRRDALRTAIGGRDEQRLLPLLEYLVYALPHPHLSRTAIHAASLLLDLYASVLGMSATVDLMLERMHQAVANTLAKDKILLKLQGAVDAILASQQMQHFATEQHSAVAFDLKHKVDSIMADLSHKE